MWEESHHRENNGAIMRSLRDDEFLLIKYLLQNNVEKNKLILSLNKALVREMNDGGMGGIRFIWQGVDNKRFGKTLAECNFFDEDGVELSVSLNADENGDLFELDIWKVDFSPLIRFPKVDN